MLWKAEKWFPITQICFQATKCSFCAFSTIFPPLSEILLGNKTIHYFEDVDGQRNFPDGLAKQDFFFDGVSEMDKNQELAASKGISSYILLQVEGK